MAMLITPEDRPRNQRLLIDSFALRKRILVDKLHWELPCGESPLEIDDFDRGDACHLMSLTKDGAVRGTLRATCSLSPNVTCDILQPTFQAQLPRAADIGEASRLCIDLDLSAIERQAARADLFVSYLEFCVERGWLRTIGILRRSLLFDFTRSGMTMDLLSPLVAYGRGTDVAAAFMMASAQADLDRCRSVLKLDTALRRQPIAQAAPKASAA